MIIVDTREKKWQHIEEYFKQSGVPYRVQKLDVGDYVDDQNMLLVVDRKRNLIEVAQNLCSPDNSRFWKELNRAYKSKVHLVILIEHGGKIKELKDVAEWSHPYCRISGKRLQKQMFNAYLAYGVEWKFCSKRQTGKRILEELKWPKVT